MITSKKELDFYIKADNMMNRGCFCKKTQILKLAAPDYIMKYLKELRKASYYQNRKKQSSSFLNKLLCAFHHRKYKALGMKLGFSISCDALGYGVVIPHYGTIVVGDGNQIGNYCVLHTTVCVTAGKKRIGDGFHLSTGAKVINNIEVPDGVTVDANAVLLSSVEQENCLVVGSPAIYKAQSKKWWLRDGVEFQRRVEAVEKLKKEMGL